MKRLLPFLIIFLFFFTFFYLTDSAKVYALTPTPTLSPAPTVITPAPQQIWNSDPEVTFVGKVGARSGKFLDWALEKYEWSSSTSALASFWKEIWGIVSIISLLFVLASAFVMIITRGKSVTIARFVPRFLLIMLLVTLSFAIIQAIYQTADIVQGMFLKNPDGKIIQQQDLLYIGFNYEDFEGYRLVGSSNDESAFISLLLVKLTAITYYTMTGILLLRKVILWFFIIISPIFPLLLLYKPIRNTGKIWIGEFFRWVLYAPIFAVFLSGVVKLWRSGTSLLPGIPLSFPNIGDAYPDPTNSALPKIVYPTAINILLGGPGQKLAITNSVNITDTFALYVVALLMLWVVILLPFLLLQIFLDYLHTFSFGEVAIFKQIMNASYPLLNKYGLGGGGPAPSTPPGTPPIGPASAGMARALPFSNKMELPENRSVEISNISENASSQIANSMSSQSSTSMSSQIANTIASQISSSQLATSKIFSSQLAKYAQQNKQILNLTNLSVPTMRDIAKFETASLSHDITRHQEIAQTHEKLEKIANPRMVATTTERENYIKVRENLVQAKQQGNPVAVSILSAAGHVSQKATGIKLPQAIAFPTSNRVQSVNLDDYESVKKMWKENYQKLEPPKTINGINLGRKEWVKQEIDVITQTINYLSSDNQQKISQGMEMVSKILPFLLIGGFSHEEVIAYLKAKLEAAKSTMEELASEEEEDETRVDVKKKHEETQKEMTTQAEKPIEDEASPEGKNLEDPLVNLEKADNKEKQNSS